ncbi:type 2 isopentenyl-diphosphate Delta-isomerase [Thiomicrorhabdus xiamenensis]|uniref:Isopentenyl-diphosphate delta-isomerase n=1 Tax=Thiomicrorhabdus xiamenensis TaxID=2739063 RepID=A0A7D4NPU7_9GAMM|nr:type 2 isopentenyl-diphosphate Delta-isomerase [Thiomicrorhabdus xiamenensis]QKI88671.1 type 2 isopentenyl-diphosphate Delta-isomerase [Thiomicrorhabdus xiamenensis]
MSREPNQQQQITQRKQDHIRAILEDPQVERHSDFEQIRLMHRALPEIDYAQVDTSCAFLGKKLRFPFLISSMTGGAAQNLQQINRHLAEAAENSQVAMAVGSQRTMIRNASAEESFKIRQYAPSIPLIANIGAVQLNYGFGVDEIRRAIDILQADAIYLHLNPLQEIIQPEGDSNFSALADKIARLAEQIEQPIILKEVGSGLSPQDIQLGLDAGIEWFDLAGHGGTSWSRIEAHRSDNDLGILLQDWGLSTSESLYLAQPFIPQAKLIASGGIRSGIDMLKSVVMGARLAGVAAPLLQPAMTSSEEVAAKIAQFHQEFTAGQFLLGIEKFADLHFNSDLILQSPWHSLSKKRSG